MISEEMLKKAAAEADQAIRDSLPAPAECEHEFSPSFERKMRRTFRKAKHPVIYKLPRYAACFCSCGGSRQRYMADSGCRSARCFFAWVRERYEAFVEYRFIGEVPQENTIIEYELTWLPEGFSFQKEQRLGNSTYITYTDNSGQRIIFSYLQGNDSTSLFMAADYTEVQSVQIGNTKADFYQASQETAPKGFGLDIRGRKPMLLHHGTFIKGHYNKMAEGHQKNNQKISNQLSKITSFIRLRGINK